MQHLLLAGSPDEMVALERVAATRDMLSWVPPPKALFDSFWAPYAFVLRPEVEGLEGMVQQLNGRPALFVMNHSLGGIEMPITIRYCMRAPRRRAPGYDPSTPADRPPPTAPPPVLKITIRRVWH